MGWSGLINTLSLVSMIHHFELCAWLLISIYRAIDINNRNHQVYKIDFTKQSMWDRGDFPNQAQNGSNLVYVVSFPSIRAFRLSVVMVETYPTTLAPEQSLDILGQQLCSIRQAFLLDYERCSRIAEWIFP